MKILVIDDSALMRRALKEILEAIPGAEVRSARNGKEGLEVIREWDPKVVTLDVNMPVMDGLTCLSHIMSESPRPVIMVSSITQKDSIPSLEALSMGAVDVIEKPDGTVSRRLGEIGHTIRTIVKGAARANVGQQAKARSAPSPKAVQRPAPQSPSRPAPKSGAKTEKVILLGVSTGGPGALELILPKLPGSLPAPIVVAQHMPGNFTGSFAQRLNQRCELEVVEVTKVTPVDPGTIYIIHGGNDGLIERRLGRVVLRPVETDPKYTWHPSVGRMVESALDVLNPTNTLGVMLTGMGDDGAEAMCELAKRGGHTIAEAETSSVVFGMPRELIERGGAKEVCDLNNVATRIRTWAGEES